MDDSTQLIVGDAAVSALEEAPRRRFFRRKKKQTTHEPLTHCENCGAQLSGEYCSACGQHAIDYRRSLWRVLIDAADSFLNWDTKFVNSVGVLLAKPWKLTNDFNSGRRARYVHPLRLYLLASIAFFLIARLLNMGPVGSMEFRPEDRAQLDAALTKLTGPESNLNEEQRAQVEAVRARLNTPTAAFTEEDQAAIRSAMKKPKGHAGPWIFSSDERAKVREALDRVPDASPTPTPADQAQANASPAAEQPSAAPKRKPNKFVHFSDDDEVKSPFESWLESRIKEKVGEDGTKGKLFLETLRSNVPTMMLCCIPLFAFVLKTLYVRRKRFYIEHLVYALHIHSFVYVAVVVISLLSMGAARWAPPLTGWLIGILTTAACVQVFLSIRRVYGQGWFFTTFKFLLGGFVYLVILAFGVAATAFVTLVMPG